jgi:hypothetical protein
MKKLLSLLVFITIISTVSYAQEELKLYKNIYHTADSLLKIGQISAIDSTVFKKAKELGKKHPTAFFETSGDYLTQSKFNEAAFMYYLGLMRFRYYNSANPKYKPGGDGALLGSFSSILGEPINMYLRTDIDNFILILKMTTDYARENDFRFFSKEKDPKKYDTQIKSCSGIITELEDNKAKYREEWATERQTMEQTINEALEQQKNQDNEQKQK